MEQDPNVETGLDTFSLILPLPYRIAVIFVLGVWAWGLNLHYLSILKIDVPALIKYHTRVSSSTPPHHQRTYRLAATVTLPLIVSILFFWLITHGQSSLVITWDILPQSFLFLLAVFFFIPIHRLSRAGRYRFLTTLKRVSIGGIAEADNGKFGDILLADVLTSYAKVLGDLFVSICMFISPGVSSTDKPDRSCGGAYMVPLIISIPSLIRLRQCLIEFQRVRKHPTSSSGWGGQHLANALKYSSAFPVIILSALQRGTNPNDIGMSEAGLFRLWLFFVFLNSFYSFYWDVAKDWDLTLFSPASVRNNPEHPWGLRRHTHFHTKEMYYGAIVIDLMLRCTWSFKLSPHLDHFNDLEGGIFVMEFLEVLRRWMWIFFRVETEWVRTNRGPLPDDILLGDFNGGIDSPSSPDFPK
ncbi:hypothetical protein OEA41_004329 [Lepraria neglecta]|uniref:EXS domain-containing protein n=1 Tax=Lepraria neglecta TaxID=209136 RepID=A0AAD9YZY1_9LECA|nr:hypothetical protein OEA41_004329 [Lepraria neglecta]